MGAFRLYQKKYSIYKLLYERPKVQSSRQHFRKHINSKNSYYLLQTIQVTS